MQLNKEIDVVSHNWHNTKCTIGKIQDASTRKHLLQIWVIFKGVGGNTCQLVVIQIKYPGDTGHKVSQFTKCHDLKICIIQDASTRWNSITIGIMKNESTRKHLPQIWVIFECVG